MLLDRQKRSRAKRLISHLWDLVEDKYDREVMQRVEEQLLGDEWAFKVGDVVRLEDDNFAGMIRPVPWHDDWLPCERDRLPYGLEGIVTQVEGVGPEDPNGQIVVECRFKGKGNKTYDATLYMGGQDCMRKLNRVTPRTVKTDWVWDGWAAYEAFLWASTT